MLSPLTTHLLILLMSVIPFLPAGIPITTSSLPYPLPLLYILHLFILQDPVKPHLLYELCTKPIFLSPFGLL